MKIQASKETCGTGARTAADDGRRNDLTIRDCCLYFNDRARGRGAMLVSMDKLLCIECIKEGEPLRCDEISQCATYATRRRWIPMFSYWMTLAVVPTAMGARLLMIMTFGAAILQESTAVSRRNTAGRAGSSRSPSACLTRASSTNASSRHATDPRARARAAASHRRRRP